MDKMPGATESGFAELKDYYKYPVVGRGTGYGKAVDLEHKYAIALIVEMLKDLYTPALNPGRVQDFARHGQAKNLFSIKIVVKPLFPHSSLQIQTTTRVHVNLKWIYPVNEIIIVILQTEMKS